MSAKGGAIAGSALPAHRFRLSLLDVGLACCGVEAGAADLTDLGELVVDSAVAGSDVVDSSGDVGAGDDSPVAHVLLVSGTVTDKLAGSVARLYAALPEPRYVISFGACSNTGGPYWDGYSVTKGVDQLVPVDVFVPGCPPRPETLRAALATLSERIRQRPHAAATDPAADAAAADAAAATDADVPSRARA